MVLWTEPRIEDMEMTAAFLVDIPDILLAFAAVRRSGRNS